MLHATLLVTLGFMVQVTQRGGDLEPARGGGIVLARDADGTAEYFGEEDVASSSQSQTQQQQQTSEGAIPTADDMPVDLAGSLPQPISGNMGSDVADTLPSASGFADGARPSGGRVNGNQAKTSVFGAEGVGNKFVYVFDRSASMDGYQGRPLAAAKAELSASLEDLDKIHQFQIIFYNEQPSVFNPNRPQPPSMLFGDTQTKRLAQNYVRGIVAAGGTKHMEALKMALGMNPDVIFFLTDADEPQLSASELEEIRQRNARVGASINTIQFGAGLDQGGNNFLVRLAKMNGGHHVYVDVTRLPGGAL